MKGLFHSKARRAAGTLMAAVSALMISSCAPKRADIPVAAPRPLVQKKVLAARALKAKMPALESVWEGGHCKFQENSVSYYSFGSGKTTTLKLDVKVEGSDLLLCSNTYTVLLAKDRAFVALGGLDILDGREWFGQLGDRFTWANSYELNLRKVIEKGGNPGLASLVGDRLHIMGKEKTWSIDLGDPFKGWKVY